jgi:anti-anti-sigma factor
MASDEGTYVGATAVAASNFEVLREPPVAEVRRGPDWVVVVLQGELDLNNAWELREVLEQECGGRPARLVLDLSRVSFLDSTTLHVLLQARKLLRDWGGVVLSAPNAAVRRTLAVCGFDGVLTVEDRDGQAAGVSTDAA